jgi:DNA-dependent RNA polymerase auxiliary subunit epsilon
MRIYDVKLNRTIIQYLLIKDVEAENEDEARKYIAEDMRKYRGRIEHIAYIEDTDDVDFEIEQITDKTESI